MNDILHLCSLAICFSRVSPMILTTSSKSVNTVSERFSGDHLDLAAAGAFLRDDELPVDLLL